MEKIKKNLEESVYSRLKNVARQRKRLVQEILKYYAMERFLYRLSVSCHQSAFYLKGGLMLMVWDPMSHRLVNTRMKDFYDIWLLTQQFDFDRNELKEIIHQVLANRGTIFEATPIAFLESFYDNSTKKDKWNAFLKNISHSPLSLENVVKDLRLFFKNVLE